MTVRLLEKEQRSSCHRHSVKSYRTHAVMESQAVATPTTHPKANQRRSDLPTPPPSPVQSRHLLSETSSEANSRILLAKREGKLKAVISEFCAMKKQNVPVTLHTYNLVFDAHETLRRGGTPVDHVLKCTYPYLPKMPV